MATSSWQVEGTYFEACNCTSMCPCVLLGSPTEGNCTVLLAWHVDSGRYGDVALDGCNAVMLGYTPGHMMTTKWKVALYLDDTASGEQQQALGAIFSGQAGGPLGALAPLVGEVMGVRPAPITFTAEGNTRSLRVGDLLAMDIAGIEGQGGKLVTVENVPFTPVPGVPAVVAKSSALSIHDHGFDLEMSERNGFYSPFTYQN